MYALADRKNTTVGELTGTRNRYYKIRVPEKLQSFIGEKEIRIDYVDEGISSIEIMYWNAYYEVQDKENKDNQRRGK